MYPTRVYNHYSCWERFKFWVFSFFEGKFLTSIYDF